MGGPSDKASSPPPPPSYDEVVRLQTNDTQITSPSSALQTSSGSNIQDPQENSRAQSWTPREKSNQYPLSSSSVSQDRQGYQSFPRSSPALNAPSSDRLETIVAVPQISSGSKMPYVRAYSNILQQHKVSKDSFVQFIDGLNIASVPSLSLQAPNLAGSAASYVPGLAGLTSLVTGIASPASDSVTKGVSHYKNKKYIERANKEYFKAKGLYVSTVSTRDLVSRLGISSASGLMPELKPEHMDLTVMQRRMMGLSGKVAPLSFDVPLRAAALDSSTRAAVRWIDETTREEENKLLQKRHETARLKQYLTETERATVAGGKDDRRIRKLERKARKASRKDEKRERRRIRREEKRSRRAQRRASKGKQRQREDSFSNIPDTPISSSSSSSSSDSDSDDDFDPFDPFDLYDLFDSDSESKYSVTDKEREVMMNLKWLIVEPL